MKLANLDNRAVLITADESAIDVHTASDGRFGPELPGIYDNWQEFRQWADDVTETSGEPFDAARLGAPSPAPRQILAIGLNYDAHAAESGFEAPTKLPPVFPKFLSALSGPVTTVTLPKSGNTDWEIELVAVIGEETHDIDEKDGWSKVAGLTVGQDLSERVRQLDGPAPQFGLGKSHLGFAPTGPYLVTDDEFADRDKLSLRCELDGEVVQEGTTDQLIASVPRLVAELSKVVRLFPGDLIFTGTPAGVGLGRDPQRFISAGQTLVSTIDGIGELRQQFVDEK